MSTRRVNTVITAAGESLHLFLTAGFGKPKSLVSVKGREVICRAVDSYAYDLTRTTVAVNQEEDSTWNISERIREAFPAARILPVSTKVRGAMATALMALDVSQESPLVIAAGDSTVSGGVSQYIDQFLDDGIDAATIAFHDTDPRWSYLQVNDSGRVERVAEKEVIGPLATTGVFYYRSISDYISAATWSLVNNAHHNGIFYVSTTLNYLIAQGKRVTFQEITREDYKSWSLPVDFTT